MQIEGRKLIFIMNFSVLDFFKFTSRMPQIAQIFSLDFQNFSRETSPPPSSPLPWVCVFSLKSGCLHTTWWRFQFWLSLPHWLCDLCTRYREVCRNISCPMPVSFFQCLLLWSTFHMHTKIRTWPGNASVWSWSWWWCYCHSRWLIVWSLQQ